MNKITLSKKILREKGPVALTRNIFRYATNFSLSPIYSKRIKKFRAKSKEDLINFAMGGCNGIISPMQVKSEISNLIEIVKKTNPKFVLEIGTAKGGTLFMISRASAKDARIISIDLPGGRFGGGYPEWRKKIYKSFTHHLQKIFLVRRNAHDKKTLEIVKKILGENKLDFLFIDGDHTYEGVKKDYEIYSPLVKKGGLIAFHDIARHEDVSCQVDKFWEEIKKGKNSKEFIEDKDQGWGGIGVLNK